MLLRVVYVMTLWLVLLPYLTFTAARMLFVGGTHGFFPQSFFRYDGSSYLHTWHGWLS